MNSDPPDSPTHPETIPERPPPATTDAQTPTRRRRRDALDVPTETREEIVKLHPHYGTRAIAPRVGFSRKVVRRVLIEEGVLAQPKTTSPASKVEPFMEAITSRVEKDLTVTRIQREITAIGYDGSRTILADKVRELRATRGLLPTRTVKRRFETRMGVEMQIDWSPYTLTIANRPVKVRAFGCLLCASRKLYLRIYRDERQSTLLEGLASAFEYFHGVTQRVVMDNMSTAVLARIGPDRNPLWHERFLSFARHYAFTPFACKPRDPDRKGKKEKSFRLVWDDLLKSTDFDSWDDLDARRRTWLDETPDVANLRTHGTTRRVPNEVWRDEEPLLIRLPEKRFAVHEDGVRPVDTDSTLSMRGTRYTVPSALAGRTVAVRIYAEHFEVLDRDGRIAFSRTYVSDEDKGKLQIDSSHYASLPRRPRASGGGERLDEALVARFPSLAPLVQGLRLRFKALAAIHYRALVRLADRYGQQAFVNAAERAQQYRRFDALAIERILASDHPLPENDSPTPLTGLGPVVLGEVESASLDRYASIDAAPVAAVRSDPQDATHEPVTHPGSPTTTEQHHGT